MRTILRNAVVFGAVYFAAWTAAYSLMFVSRGDSLDFSYFFEYFGLAWTFSGGDFPTFIWFFSIIMFLPLAGLAAFLLRRYERPKTVA